MSDENTSLLEGTETPEDQEAGNENWLAAYELDEPTTKALGRFKTPQDAFKGYANLLSMQGRVITLPKDDAPPEEKQKKLDEIYAKLGRPTKPEEYKIEKPADLPADLQWDEATANELKPLAHKLGLNQAQVAALVQFDTARQIRLMQNQLTGYEQQKTQTLATLTAEWGQGNVEKNIAAVQKTFEIYGSKDLAALFKAKGIDNDPIVLKHFYEIYKDKIAEDNLAPSLPEETKVPDLLRYPSMEKR